MLTYVVQYIYERNGGRRKGKVTRREGGREGGRDKVRLKGKKGRREWNVNKTSIVNKQ